MASTDPADEIAALTSTLDSIEAVLDPDEMHALLSRSYVGRIAFSHHDRVDIRPIHYVYSDNWLYGRTSPSEKLVILGHNQWVAFEVDEVKGPFDWQSVVAHGSFYRLTDESTPQLIEQRAVARLQAQLSDLDVVPARDA